MLKDQEDQTEIRESTDPKDLMESPVLLDPTESKVLKETEALTVNKDHTV